MKFLRYLNPFAIIRQLRAELAGANEFAEAMRRSRNDWRQLANHSIAETNQLRLIAAAQDQAIEAHMAERAELKAAIVTADRAGVFLSGQYLEVAVELGLLRNASREQARETLEAVEYVKQVEQALTSGGITIEDGENGPLVVVNQDVFLGRLATGDFKVVREEQPEVA